MERPISSNALAQVQAAIFNGQKIMAIRIYRQDTGASLTDAKAAVDKLEAEWRTVSPEKFQALPARKKGCGGICMILVIGFVVMTAILILLAIRKSQIP
jgi:hypothetical protein